MKTDLSPAERKIEARGLRIYREKIRDRVYPQETGKVLAIDVDSGEYEMDNDEMAAWERLRARRPDAVIWFKRVGYQTVHAFGGLRLDENG